MTKPQGYKRLLWQRIYVWTIQHTATWTTMDWLDRQGYNIVETVQLINVMRGNAKRTCLKGGKLQKWGAGMSPVALHSHFSCLKPNPVYQGQKAVGGQMPHQLAIAISMTNPTLIPMRDPLAGCIRKQRQFDQNQRGHDGAGHLFNWVGLAGIWPELCQAPRPLVLLAWDAQTVSREEALKRATERLNLDQEITKTFIQDNPVQNTMGNYPYKKAYLERDSDYFKSKLPDLWTKLKEAEPVLRPFLESHGYRNLIWWS